MTNLAKVEVVLKLDYYEARATRSGLHMKLKKAKKAYGQGEYLHPATMEDINASTIAVIDTALRKLDQALTDGIAAQKARERYPRR